MKKSRIIRCLRVVDSLTVRIDRLDAIGDSVLLSRLVGERTAILKNLGYSTVYDARRAVRPVASYKLE